MKYNNENLKVNTITNLQENKHRSKENKVTEPKLYFWSLKEYCCNLKYFNKQANIQTFWLMKLQVQLHSDI